jgi:cobalt/nickel transport system permease protein
MDLDRYVPRDSPIHAFDARLKLLLALAVIVVIALLPSGAMLAFGIVFGGLVVCSVVARLGPWRLLRGSWVALPFVLVALPLLFTRPGEAFAVFEVGPLTLGPTREGLRDVLTILAKSWLSVQVALLLTYTTSFPDLIEAFRELRLPAIMVSIISFMYRYIAVIGDEAGRMNRARAARSGQVPGAGGGSLAWRARVTGSMVGSLFIRAYERSERVYAAMLARGYDGTAHVVAAPRPDGASLAVSAALVAGLLAFLAAAHLVVPTW